MFYDKDNAISDIKTFILSDKSVAETVDSIYFDNLVKKGAEDFIKHHKTLVEELYEDKNNLLSEREKITSLRNRIEQIKKEQFIDKQEKEELVEIIKGNYRFFKDAETSRQNSLDTIIEEEDILKKEYNTIFNKIKEENGCDSGNSNKCAGIDKYYNLENMMTNDHSSLDFIWPASPSFGASSFFHDEGYKAFVGADHLAIDLKTPQGTPIESVERGYVSYILPPTSTGYSFMAVRHPGGYTSVYGHMSKINVKLFQEVEKGEIIGLSGGAVGTLGAGPATTGPHLHFEMFYGMTRIDPLSKLNILELKYDELFDSKENRKMYFDRFYELDEKERSKIDFQKFKIKGDTEKERQQRLLEVYASSSFQDWNTWVSASVKHDIDPSFVMCIGLAETNLGNKLKSGFNVGNIGNNDRGDTQSFANAHTGIELIGKTLNNKYLSQYDTMDKLSRWGNLDQSKPIYASDPINWQKNINKCISALKGKPITDSYEFRLKD